MNYYLLALKKYAVFNGRASRKEYWMFLLFNIIFSIIAIILDSIFGITIKEIGYGPIYILFILAMFLPALAISVRRLHDIGKSGWMYLIIFIPIIGVIWFLILMVTDSNPEENIYGQNPKHIATI